MSAAPDRGPVRTTCPYCGVGCGVLADVEPDGAVAVRGDPEHPANFGRLCSKGSALGETRRPRRPAARARRFDGRRASWDEALDLVADDFLEDDRRARARLGRLLRLRPVADRGLLRRQQADEGLHRLGQYRHQLAPLHVLLRRGPQARLRLGHGARNLRGSGTGRSRRAGRLQPRLVPSGPVPAARGGEAGAAGHARRRDRSAPRPTTADIADLHLPIRARRRRARCSTACFAHLADDGRARPRLYRRRTRRASPRRSPRRARAISPRRRR